MRAGGRNTLYDRLAGRPPRPVALAAGAPPGQARFLAGLEPSTPPARCTTSSRASASSSAATATTPVLLVQGPPGTGKSYSTAFAVFARLQGAMAAGQRFRVFVSCKTHAATDVLLENVVEVRQMLRGLCATRTPRSSPPTSTPACSTCRSSASRPRDPPPDGVIPLPQGRRADRRARRSAIDSDRGRALGVVAATPGGIYGLLKDRWAEGPLRPRPRATAWCWTRRRR